MSKRGFNKQLRAQELDLTFNESKVTSGGFSFVPLAREDYSEIEMLQRENPNIVITDKSGLKLGKSGLFESIEEPMEMVSLARKNYSEIEKLQKENPNIVITDKSGLKLDKSGLFESIEEPMEPMEMIGSENRQDLTEYFLNQRLINRPMEIILSTPDVIDLTQKQKRRSSGLTLELSRPDVIDLTRESSANQISENKKGRYIASPIIIEDTPIIQNRQQLQLMKQQERKRKARAKRDTFTSSNIPSNLMFVTPGSEETSIERASQADIILAAREEARWIFDEDRVENAYSVEQLAQMRVQREYANLNTTPNDPNFEEDDLVLERFKTVDELIEERKQKQGVVEL